MANLFYDIAKKFLVSTSSAPYKRINLLSSTIRVALVGSTYVQASSHRTFRRGGGVVNSASCYELNGVGYTKGLGASTGRKTLTGKTMTQDDVNGRAVFTSASVTWTGINAGTAGKAVLLLQGYAGSTLSDTGTMLLCTIDDGFPYVTNGANLTLQWSTAGCINVI